MLTQQYSKLLFCCLIKSGLVPPVLFAVVLCPLPLCLCTSCLCLCVDPWRHHPLWFHLPWHSLARSSAKLLWQTSVQDHLWYFLLSLIFLILSTIFLLSRFQWNLGESCAILTVPDLLTQNLWNVVHIGLVIADTFLRNKLRRGKGLCPCFSSTNWENRSTVMISGRVQKDERCVGQLEGEDSIFPGSPKRRFIKGLPASPSSAPILFWASARLFCKSWKQAEETKLYHFEAQNVFSCLWKTLYSLPEALGWWQNHKQASPTAAVSVWRTDRVLHCGNLC